MTELNASDDVLLCGTCGMPHHQDCWDENAGCATFGCVAADHGSATVSTPPYGTCGVDGLTMLVATFGPTTGWSGKVITLEGEVFTLQDYGPITALDVLTYDRQGQLVWADGRMRAWVESEAGSALGSPEESTPALEPMLAAERVPAVEESAAPAASSVDVPVVSIAGEISRLAELHVKGILTDDEFAAAKGKLLK